MRWPDGVTNARSNGSRFVPWTWLSVFFSCFVSYLLPLLLLSSFFSFSLFVCLLCAPSSATGRLAGSQVSFPVLSRWIQKSQTTRTHHREMHSTEKERSLRRRVVSLGQRRLVLFACSILAINFCFPRPLVSSRFPSLLSLSLSF